MKVEPKYRSFREVLSPSGLIHRSVMLGKQGRRALMKMLLRKCIHPACKPQTVVDIETDKYDWRTHTVPPLAHIKYAEDSIRKHIVCTISIPLCGIYYYPSPETQNTQTHTHTKPWCPGSWLCACTFVTGKHVLACICTYFHRNRQAEGFIYRRNQFE